MNSVRFPVVLLLTAIIAGCSSSTGPDLSQMSFSDEPLIGKFVWYDLITDDAEAARRFYGGLFGWSFDRREGPGGKDYYLAHDDGRIVGGVVAVAEPPDGSELSRWLPYVSVGDVDASTSRARVEGGRIVVEPLDVRLGRVAAIVDPQGAAIGLARSTIGDPDDATTAGGTGRIVWAELLADDDEAAASFYRTVVGCETRTIDRRGGEYTMLVGAGRDRAGIFPNPTDWDPQWITHFGVTDPAAAAARAEELGGTVLLAPTPEVREGSIAIVSDPSGAVLVLSKWLS
jgi:predicted enzyme related to lactoylglutathione lyase